MMKAVALLGPQHVVPTAGRLLSELRVTGKVALITAGWQERETDDQALVAELGVPAVNLTLHARSEEVFARDTELAAAYKERQTRLRLLQDFYRVRLEHTAEAGRVISLRQVDPALLADEHKVSLALIRRLDHDHLERCERGARVVRGPPPARPSATRWCATGASWPRSSARPRRWSSPADTSRCCSTACACST